MVHSESWRELYHTNDFSLARTVATCIEGMEFDVRLRDAIGRVVDESAHGGDALTQASFRTPFGIDVLEHDWAALRDVVNELIAEQMEFDSKVEADRQKATRVAQLVVLSVIALVASFVGVTSLKQCQAERP